MWTPTTRQQHSRTVTRYQTDLTDAEWLVIAPHLPKPCATGRPREWPMREIINGIFYVIGRAARGGWCRTTYRGTIYRWFAVWCDDGCFERINHALVMVSRGALPFIQRVFANSGYMAEAVRHHRGLGYSPDAVRTWQIANGSGATPALRQQSSTARSAKTTEAGGPRGYDATRTPIRSASPAHRDHRTGLRHGQDVTKAFVEHIKKIKPGVDIVVQTVAEARRGRLHRPIGKCWKACRRRSARWSRRSCGTILASLPRQHWSA